MDYPGNLFVIAAPSGAGKSTLVKALLQLDAHLMVSISHTTRAPRGQETDGREYHFIDAATFRAKIAAGDFFESAEVHGHLYGTSRAAIEARVAGGQDVVLEIDWQGALQIKRLFPNAVLIFILPPSWEELAQRLNRRGEDEPEEDELATLVMPELEYDPERSDQLMCFWITDFNSSGALPGLLRKMYVCIDPESGAIIPQAVEAEYVATP